MTKLTRDQIRAMPASRQMDMLILIALRMKNPQVKYHWRQTLPHYTEDIADAFTALTSTHRAVNLARVRPNLWEASMIDVSPPIIAEAETAPLAICRMLLLAGLESDE